MKTQSSASSIVGHSYALSQPRNSVQQWIREGARMAKRDPDGVADSIAALHTAESASFAVLSDTLKVEGRKVLEERDDLQMSLESGGFDLTQHLSEQQHGRIDLVIAATLAVLNVALSTFVFLG